MYDNLDRALNKTRRRFTDVCNELGLDPEDIEIEELLNAQCTNCSIWGNKFTEMIDEDNMYLCEFCYDLESLRF